VDYQVKLIVYPSEIEGRRTSKYRDGTEVPTGAIKVLMKKDLFEPKQKDFVELRGKLYKVLTIDPIAPLYQSICHILT
ncbi:ribosomal protein S7, partial [Streptococcus pneumoniae]|uniref:ribosomal protein S7 n=1 Tax=Streptococcus pneumoniae TaxID=1313 RepID=UPI001CBBB5FF